MNKSYRLIWNPLCNAWVAVAETARARGKRSGAVVRATGLGVACIGMSAFAQAGPPLPNQLPTGANVVGGNATVSQTGAVMTIGQTTQRAAVEWKSFNVGSAAQVNFVQPGASSVTLNRVLDTNPSQIFGRISAPGQVFLTNPNGVYFAPGASVDVGGLVATTHRVSTDDFMSGKAVFDRNGATGSVVNEGTLRAKLGGYIALLAPEVRNAGVVVAQLGAVALAAGEVFELQFDGGSALSGIRVQAAALNALVENRQAVLAPGGLVILSAQASGQLHNGLVRNSGVVQASGLVNDGGRVLLSASHSIQHTGSIAANAAANSNGKGGSVVLLAGLDQPGSTTTVNGSISARGGSLGGDGGFIETSGGRVFFGSDMDINTVAAPGTGGKSGTWLIDPTDFTIAASGGDLTGGQLSQQLTQNNVTIQSTNGAAGTDGNIHVNDAVSWSANQLTLNAQNNININASLRGTGNASLALEYGQGAVAAGNTSSYAVNAVVDLAAGQHFSTRQGSDGVVKNYTVITDLGAQGSVSGTDLQGMQGNLAGNYALGGNIDASGTSAWNAGAGFAPVGQGGSAFTGRLEGLGHTITGLTINRPGTDNVGLLGFAVGADVRNLGVADASFAGKDRVGALAGSTSGATVLHVRATGAQVSGGLDVGGLIGQTSSSSLVSEAYSSGLVTGVSFIGGLIGEAFTTQISNSESAATVTATAFTAGGLVGTLRSGSSIADSRASGAVTISNTPGYGNRGAGGLAGYMNGGSVLRSSATGTVNGNFYVGGLIGQGLNGASVGSSSASGAVSGIGQVGGLVGSSSGMSIASSHATGAVTGSGSSIGGLVGSQSNTSIDSSYASGAVNGSSYVGGLVGSGSYDSVSNSYATGAVTGTTNVGGLVGFTYGGSISKSYATGAVSGSSNRGGLLGYDYGFAYGGAASAANISHSFYDSSVNGGLTGVSNTPDVAGQVWGMTTADMKSTANFTSATAANGNVNPSWNLTPSTGDWSANAPINNGYLSQTANTYTTPVYLRAVASSSVYGNAPNISYGLFTTSSGGVAVTDANPSGTASWTNNPSLLFSVGQYSISYQTGITLANANYALLAGSATTVSVTARPITVRPLDQSRAVGAANPASGAVTLAVGTLATGTALGEASLFSSADASTQAGQTAALIASNQSFIAGWSGNYQISYVPGQLLVVASATASNGVPTGRGSVPVQTTAASSVPLPPSVVNRVLPEAAQSADSLKLPEDIGVAVIVKDRERLRGLQLAPSDFGGTSPR